MPTLERLVQHRFWHENVPKFHEQYMSGSDATKHTLKLTNNAKDHIKIAAQKTEQRLRDEQKSVSFTQVYIVSNIFDLLLLCFFFSTKKKTIQVKNQKRLVRVQELMSSEEEKKKIKHQKAVSIIIIIIILPKYDY